jgi:FkbM family methyltransferase
MNILQTTHGTIMVRQGTDLISQHLFQRGTFDWHTVVECHKLASGHSEGCILDIGANIGTVTIPLAQSFPQYTIHAFEPQRHVFYQLAGNVSLNDLYNVELHMCALGPCNKIVTIDLPDYKTNTNVGAWSMSEEVRRNNPEAKAGGKFQDIVVKTLDSFEFNQPVRLVKIDVEGMELDVLVGANDFLREHNYPPLVYECWSRLEWYKESARKLNEYVESFGYTLTHSHNTVIAIKK